jgi:hypothetical protein
MNPSRIALLTASTLLGLAPAHAWASRALPSGSGTFASQRSVPPNSTMPTTVARADSTGHGAGNGYVLMIHSTFEPHSTAVVDGADTGRARVDQARTGVTYASGAGGATRNGDYIVIHAIPYLVSTVYPVIVDHPLLEVDAVGSDRRLMLQPNLPPDQERICHVETTWSHHEGPIEACSVYRVPVQAFDGMNVVTMTLHFVDAGGPQEKVHSFPAHFMLHMAIENLVPIDLKAVDAGTTEASPLVIENVVDTQRSASYATRAF